MTGERVTHCSLKSTQPLDAPPLTHGEGDAESEGGRVTVEQGYDLVPVLLQELRGFGGGLEVDDRHVANGGKDLFEGGEEEEWVPAVGEEGQETGGREYKETREI